MDSECKFKNNNFVKYSDVKTNLEFECINICSEPQISIAIPTFKRPHLLMQTLESTANQNFDGVYEVIVVDNDSEDHLTEEFKQFISALCLPQVKYYRNEKNIGMYGNWNRCIELSRSKWMTILNDDDYLMENCLKSLSVGCVYYPLIIGGSRKVMSIPEKRSIKLLDRLKRNKFSRLKLSSIFWRNPAYGSLGVMFEKDKAKHIGGYNEYFYPTSDYHFIYLYWKTFGGAQLKRDVAYYCWSDNTSMQDGILENCVLNDFKFRNMIISTINSKYAGLLSLLRDYLFAREITVLNSMKMNTKQINYIRNLPVAYKFPTALVKSFLFSGIMKVVSKLIDLSMREKKLDKRIG